MNLKFQLFKKHFFTSIPKRIPFPVSIKWQNYAVELLLASTLPLPQSAVSHYTSLGCHMPLLIFPHVS